MLDNIIEIKDLNFKYKNNIILDNISFEVKKGKWINITGTSSSGKTTIVKVIAGLIKYDGEIKINGIILDKDNIRGIRSICGFVFENPSNQFIMDTVESELAFILENLNYNPQDIKTRIDEVLELIGIKHLINSNPISLSGGEAQKVLLALALVGNPLILVLDEAFSYLDMYDKNKILNTLYILKETKNLTIINITSDLEETLYGDYITILDKGKVILSGKTKEVLKEEETITSLGLEMPFIVDLSNKLKFYNLLNDIKLDMEEMVISLWK